MPPLGVHNLQISHRIPAVLELETNYKEIDIKWSQDQVSLLCLWALHRAPSTDRAPRRKSARQREENIKFTNQRFSLLGPPDRD